MLRRLLLALIVILAPSTLPAGEPTERLNVLFLGDGGHHRPADRAAQLIPVMAGRGIDVTYTERLDDLNPETLAKYDALIVYANIDRIGPDPEKALLDYVAGGGGFVPLHCASYCFRNSKDCVALVGAQFLRHGTGTFDTKVVDADHPIMKGFEPFRTWDETYVHDHHNPDKHVLQTRQEGDSEEPWTWVRTHGKGRVFYTAYGHDARTWEKPGFQDLVERGIRWASHKGEVFDSRPRVAGGLKAFEYEEATAGIPNYVPGGRWGTQGKPSRRMQKPLKAEESARHLALPPGFEARLFVSEPEIARPITMAWDHRGRLWIAESTDYPNDKLRRGEEGHDRIKICEDTDHDGRADKFTVFAEGLNIPTSITFADGGIIVLQAPETIFLKDSDGDDKADVRKVLFTGWGTSDTHAGPSNLRRGLDNWIWGIVGYSAFRGTVGGEAQRFGQGFYRFKADGSKLEFLRSTSNNSWGVGFSEEGIVFGSTANGCPSVYLPIPNRYYEGVRGWSPRVLANIDATYNFYPVTDKVRQVDWFGGFTAGAGHALYTARAYPKHYWNRTAFVSEPTGHLTATLTLQPRGSDFSSYYGWNLLASDDEWTSPIMAEVGPDGNVWVIDWYNFIVQHNPTPEGFKTGRGAAYITPLRDKTHGRIYRVVLKGSKPADPIALDPEDGPGLVEALKNDNMLWRMHAQRLLIERGQRDVVPKLVALAKDPSKDEIGLNPGAIHALWTLHGLGALGGEDADAKDAAVAALRHPSAGVRRNAAQVLPHSKESAAAILSAGLLKDEDAQVRLAALLALADAPPSDDVATALARSLAGGLAEDDRWLADAATAAAAANDRGFLAALAAIRFERPARESLLTITRRVAEHHARGVPSETIGALLADLTPADPRIARAIVAGLDAGWPRDKKATLDDKAEASIGRLFARLDAQSRGQFVSLATRWGSQGIEKYAAEVTAALLATAQDESKPEAERSDAARQWIELKRNDPDAASTLLGLINPRTPPDLAAGLIQAIGKSEARAVGQALVEALPKLTPAESTEALRLLLSRADWTPALVDGIEQGAIPIAKLDLDQKQALAGHPDKAIAERARKLLAEGGGLPDPDRQKVIDELGPKVLRQGDPARGKLVFKDQCAKCHTHNGEGGKVGPDLTGMAAHPKNELLIHILDPSRSVEGNFTQYTVSTDDGRIFNGLLASETKTAISLIDAEGKSHEILRSEIDELAASKKSVMPEGFEKQVPIEAIADLLEFLTQRGKYLPLDLRKVATIVSTRGMFYDKDSTVERLVFPDWSPKTFEGVPFVLVDPQGDRVPNVVMLRGPQGTFPPKMPRSVSLPCNVPARALHILGGVGGWAYNGGQAEPTVSMIVRLHYADGSTEDHALKNGVQIADYIRVVDVPESKLAFRLRGQQVRYLAIHPKRPSETIESIDLIKGRDATAPVVMAITAELSE